MRRTAPLILGAGPAGCAAAIALAHEGAQPLLLDRDAEPRDQLCGGFLSWRTAETLRGIGVDPAKFGGRQVEHLALHAGKHEVSVRLPGPAFGLSRRALDGALRRQAVALGAGLAIDTARVIEGTTVIGRGHEWPAETLFLATGKHDVRDLGRPRAAEDAALGLRLRLPASAARAALIDGRIELHLFAGGYAGIVLQEDGSANLCLAVRKSRLSGSGGDPRQLLADLAAGNPALAQRLGTDWPVQPVETVGAVPYGWIARDTEPGLFRLGDQAAVIPSLAGEGIAIALASGTLAARYWLARGADGARAFQHDMAARTAGPVRTARLAWAIAENPFATVLGIALAGRVPPVVRWLMQASRVEPDAPLAQPRPAP
jgi:flavin-dependent dehydrogenase